MCRHMSSSTRVAGSHSACVALFMSDRLINGEAVEACGVVLAGGVRRGGVEAFLSVVANAAGLDGVRGVSRCGVGLLRGDALLLRLNPAGVPLYEVVLLREVAAQWPWRPYLSTLQVCTRHCSRPRASRALPPLAPSLTTLVLTGSAGLSRGGGGRA